MAYLNSLQSVFYQRQSIRLLGCIIAGGLLSLSLPPINQIYLIIPCFLCLFYALKSSESMRQSIVIGLGFGFAYMLCGTYWVGHSLIVYSAKLAVFAPFASIGLSLGIALFYGVACALSYPLKRHRIMLGIGMILLLSLADLLRQYLFTGFGFNLFGMLIAGNPYLSMQAAWWGVEGMGVIALLSALLPAMIKGHIVKRAMIGLILPVLLFGAGAYRYHALSPAIQINENQIYGIRLVQPSISQADKWDRAKFQENFNRYAQLSTNARPPWIKLILWPETALPLALNQAPAFNSALASLAPQGGHLVLGSLRRDETGLYNSLYMIDDQARQVGQYDKTHLVPFGEFLPLKGLLTPLGLDKLTQGAIDYHAGATRKRLPERAAAAEIPYFSPLICYEASFSRNILPAAGADYILNISNDAWFGTTLGAHQHLAHSRLRAIEQGMPLIRGANTGISAAFDALGNELGRIGLNESGVLDVKLPPALNTNLYRDYGKIPFFFMLSMLALLLFLLYKPFWKRM
ncbi:MAG: apolipoprotein N-acyltransferase [Alphaproteobacteria bacterium]